MVIATDEDPGRTNLGGLIKLIWRLMKTLTWVTSCQTLRTPVGNSHMKRSGVVVGKFEVNANVGVAQASLDPQKIPLKTE